MRKDQIQYLKTIHGITYISSSRRSTTNRIRRIFERVCADEEEGLDILGTVVQAVNPFKSEIRVSQHLKIYFYGSGYRYSLLSV